MEPRPVTIGRYELRRVLARNATSTVHEAWDSRIARKVAIKIVALPEFADFELEQKIDRFKREAQAAGGLQHPNIVGIHDYGETHQIAYIVMEYVNGSSLKAVFDRHERFATPMILSLMGEVLAGLQYSHQRGIVHRDIKPSNIMLTADGHAKIADFGIARIESSSMTQPGTVMGTPSYMSPEQFLGEIVDARTDIYSAGVVLYQMLTGERPYEGGVSTIMHQVLHAEPPKPSRVSPLASPQLDAVVARAMARRREDRFPSAKAFAEALQAAADPTVISRAPMARGPDRRPPPPPQSIKPPTRQYAATVAVSAAALAVLAGAGAGLFWLSRPQASAPLIRPEAKAVNPAPVRLAVAPVARAPAAPPPAEFAHPAPPAAPAPPLVPVQAQPAAPSPALPLPPPAAPRLTEARLPPSTPRPAGRAHVAGSGRLRAQAPAPPAIPLPPSPAPTEAPTPWIGLRAVPVSAEAAARLGMGGPAGLLVTGVDGGGPADKAHLRPPDVVLAFNGTVLTGTESLERAVRGTAIGEAASVEVWRDGRLMKLDVTAEQAPAPSLAAR